MAPWSAVKLSKINANTPRERWKRTKDTNLCFVCDEEKKEKEEDEGVSQLF